MTGLRASACVAVLAVACAPEPPAPIPSGAPPTEGARTNPFDGARLYVNPDYVAEIEKAAANAPADAPTLKKLEPYSTAIWLNSIESAGTASRYLDDAARGPQPSVVVFAIYNLPNRDCAAASSEGELSVEHGGERKYQVDFIDRIAAQLKSHPSVRVVGLLEPDSLANIATNLKVPKCKASDEVYRRSIAYAIHALSMPNVSLYLDAAHAGWLGWDRNRENIAKIYADVITKAGGEGSLRGFATNVSNYNSLDAKEGQKLEPSDPCPDELTYVHKLAESTAAAGIHASGFVIDTSRDGRPSARAKWGSWCNVRGAGLGERPHASPVPGVDAYYWVKPPGESDGTSDPAAPRYDKSCSSPDSAPGAPQAGELFTSYAIELAKLANPPL
jgi:cellulose 1,4-beta-cellobiosidase